MAQVHRGTQSAEEPLAERQEVVQLLLRSAGVTM